MQQEIQRRQSRRGLGLGAELGGLGEGAAADAAAMDAAGDDTEEEKQNEELQPLEDLDEDPPKLANPNFTKWHKPCRDPEQVRDHWETFVNQVKRAAWYRAMISFLAKNSASHGITTLDEWLTAPGCSPPGQRFFCLLSRHTRPCAGHMALFPLFKATLFSNISAQYCVTERGYSARR